MDSERQHMSGPGVEARRLAEALHASASAVLTTDADGVVEYANPACCRLLGRPEGELLGRSLEEALQTVDAGPSRVPLAEAMRLRTGWDEALALALPDQGTVHAQVAMSPVCPSGGPLQGFVVSLLDISERVETERALRAANLRLADAAARDPLTRLYNRGHFLELLEREAARARRYGNALSVVMVDLDGFKRVNDEEGHVRGDQVLESVAAALPLGVREGDVVARWGGDEFAVLLPNTDRAAARAVADRLCSYMRTRTFGTSRGLRLTLSVGVATVPSSRAGPLPSAVDLVRRADAALLAAKRGGGNDVSEWQEPPEA